MKKILLLVSVFLVLACSKNDKQKWNPDVMISLRPETGVKSEAGTPTAREVVEQTSQIMYWHTSGPTPQGRGFSEGQRDLENNRLLMFSDDVIDPVHGLVPFFIECTDLVFVKMENYIITDTLAYIPNTTLRAAEAIIKTAYAEEDYETCYRTFDNAWRFIPTTGEQWRKLKEQGLN